MNTRVRVNKLQELISEIKDVQQSDEKIELIKKLEELLKIRDGKHQHEIENLETNINQLRSEIGRLSTL